MCLSFGNTEKVTFINSKNRPVDGCQVTAKMSKEKNPIKPTKSYYAQRFPVGKHSAELLLNFVITCLALWAPSMLSRQGNAWDCFLEKQCCIWWWSVFLFPPSTELNVLIGRTSDQRFGSHTHVCVVIESRSEWLMNRLNSRILISIFFFFWCCVLGRWFKDKLLTIKVPEKS